MSNEVINVDQVWRDATGNVLANGTLTFNINLTTTLDTIFSDEALTIPQANPYTLDAAGRTLGDVKYTGLKRVISKDSSGATIRTYDNVAGMEVMSTLRTHYDFTTQIGTNSHPDAVTGDIIETNYYSAAFSKLSGTRFVFSGTTTAGKAGNVPDSDGFFYDADGKQFSIDDDLNVGQWGAIGDGSADDTAEIQAAANYVGSFVDILSDPRRGGIRLFFPYGRYKISAPITWNFTSDGFTATEIYGDSIMNGAQIEGTHAGDIFTWTHGEHAEIHHLSFYGAGCVGIRQTTFGTGFYTSAFHFHHLEFNRNLDDCFVGNLQFTTWEHVQFGRFGTPSPVHRHIFNDGATSAANLNTFRYCSFVGAANDYSTKLTSGDNWLFEVCRWENNNTPSHLLTGLAKVVFDDCWWENNNVIAQGATPWEIKTDDFGGIELRTLIIKNSKLGVTSDHDHFIKSTTDNGLLNIIVQNNSGSGFPVGFAFTDYDGVEEDGIVDWKFNSLVNYTHNNYDVGKFTNDAFVTLQGSAILNVTGDGTVVAVTFDTVPSNRVGSLASSIHTATNTGEYRYSCTISLAGLLATHTTATLSLVTTSRTYTTDINIGAVRTAANTATIAIDQGVIMDFGDTARITLTISGGTKVVDITNVTTIFSGERIVNS